MMWLCGKTKMHANCLYEDFMKISSREFKAFNKLFMRIFSGIKPSLDHTLKEVISHACVEVTNGQVIRAGVSVT